jgi:shikimate kinase
LSRRGVALVGYRGTGKSTVGRILAERLEWRFADADHEVEARAGRPIARIFAEDGEAGFRDLEEQVLADLTALPNTVIATGGGAILRSVTRDRLRSFGLVVWLTADAGTLAKRLARDPRRLEIRPALTSVGTLDEIADVLAARLPHYREVADLEIGTAGRSCREVAEAVIRALGGVEAGRS